jgi:hypothetical protein
MNASNKQAEHWEIGWSGEEREALLGQERMPAPTWGTFAWPAWVPSAIRREIERFWDERFGRGPLEWMENAAQNRVPALGSQATLQRMKRGIKVAVREEDYEFCRGRYMHCWNNIGRLVHEDGSFSYVAVGHPQDSVEQFAEQPGKGPTDM